MDRKKNPFTVAFAMKPKQFVPRYQQMKEIIDTFNSEYPSSTVYMLSGVRGSGKTVMMYSIAEELKGDEDWIVIPLNVNRDILHSFAAHLYDVPILKPFIIETKIDLSLLGIGISLEKSNKVSDVETAIIQLLKIIKKLKKRVLITIDDVSDNEAMRAFCSAFTIFIGEGYPLFLLMTGIYENIFELQNEKTLTFLYRAPRIEMNSLNIGAIADSYQSVFKIGDEKALEMAHKTKGYSYAFQVLGYMTWLYSEESDKQIEKRVSDYLGEYSYSKIWYELSEKDKEVVSIMARNEFDTVKVIRDAMKLESNAFSVYRSRLLRKGVLVSRGYGKIEFALPYFKEFVLNQL